MEGKRTVGNQRTEGVSSVQVPSEITERELKLMRLMQAIPPEISESDLKLMRFIGEEKMMRIDHLARLVDQTLASVRHTVKRLNRLGYVNAILVLAKEGDRPWLWLTEEGLQLLGFGHRLYKPAPSLRQLSHVFSIVELRLHYAARHPEWRWVSERTLANMQTRRSCKRRHLPDGALETKDGLILVEAELSLKVEPNLSKAMRENDERARTHYHCPTSVRKAVEKMRDVEGLTRTHVFGVPGELLWPARKSGFLPRR